MMKLIFLLLLVSAQMGFASTIELNGGDTVVVNANYPTTVYCRSNNFCSEVGKSLFATLESCEKTHVAFICAHVYMANFKASTPPECGYSLVQACIQFCAKTRSISCEDECLHSN